MTKKKDEIFEKLSALKPAIPTATRLKKKDPKELSDQGEKALVLSDIVFKNLTALERIRKEMFHDVEKISSVVLSGVLETYTISYEMFKYNMNVFTSFFTRERKK